MACPTRKPWHGWRIGVSPRRYRLAGPGVGQVPRSLLRPGEHIWVQQGGRWIPLGWGEGEGAR